MKNKSEQAKFFCESCGKEVKQNEQVCTYCGKTGSTSEFENGCPDCGYAVGKTPKNSNIKSNYQNKKTSSLFNSIINNKNNNNTQNSDSLPLWMYLVSIFVLIVVLICFYSCLK